MHIGTLRAIAYQAQHAATHVSDDARDRGRRTELEHAWQKLADAADEIRLMLVCDHGQACEGEQHLRERAPTEYGGQYCG